MSGKTSLSDDDLLLLRDAANDYTEQGLHRTARQLIDLAKRIAILRAEDRSVIDPVNPVCTCSTPAALRRTT